MPKFAANLSLLFQEHPMLDRFEAARVTGFDAVEMLFPYDYPTQEIAAALARNTLPLVLINTPTPDWDTGGRGCAALSGHEDRFRQRFEQAVSTATALNAKFIHIMSGLAQGPAAMDTLIANLDWAARHAPNQPLTIEPINPIDMPGYFLNSFDQAAIILDAVNAPNLALQFDAYHAHMITGDVIKTWDTHGHRAAHVQIAGAPGRHEPTACDIDYLAFFARLNAESYPGYVSAEYLPRTTTSAGLDWLPLT